MIFLDCQTTWVKLDNMETGHAKSPQVDPPEYTPVSRLKKHMRGKPIMKQEPEDAK